MTLCMDPQSALFRFLDDQSSKLATQAQGSNVPTSSHYHHSIAKLTNLSTLHTLLHLLTDREGFPLPEEPLGLRDMLPQHIESTKFYFPDAEPNCDDYFFDLHSARSEGQFLHLRYLGKCRMTSPQFPSASTYPISYISNTTYSSTLESTSKTVRFYTT